MKKNLFFLFLFSFSLLVFGKPPKKITQLAGYETNGKLKFLFLVRNWPKDTEALLLKQRLSENSEWKELGDGPIYPELSLERNWKALGLNEEQIDKYKADFAERLKKKKLRLVSRQKMLEATRKMNGVPSGTLISFNADFAKALFFGFAFIDNSPVKGAEYGLFTVDSEGQVASTPIAVYKNIPVKEIKLENISAFASKLGGIKIKFTVPASVYQQANIIGFKIFRSESKGKWIKIEDSIGALLKGDKRDFSYTDTNAASQKFYQYSVVPFNCFQKEYPKTIIKYNPETDGLLEPVQLKEVKQEGEKVKISWSVPESDLPKISGFYIKRRIGFDGQLEKITPLLKPEKEIQYMDSKLVSISNKMLTYLLVTVKKDKTEIQSKGASLHYIISVPKKLLPAPKNLKAEIIMKDNKTFVHLTWDKVAGADGYMLYNKLSTDKMLGYLSGMPLIKETSYDWEIPWSYGGLIQFLGIAAVKEDKAGYQIHGEKAVISLELPYLKLHPPKKLNVKYQFNSDSMLITWKYPELKGLLGFKLFMNGKEVDSASISPKARSFLLHDYVLKSKIDKSIILGIAAYNKYTISSDAFTSRDISMLPDIRSLTAPEDFKATQRKEGDRLFIDLSWEAVDLKAKDAVGYSLKVRKKGDCSWNTVQYDLTDNKATYEVPADNKPDELFFILALKKLKKQEKGAPYRGRFSYGRWSEITVKPDYNFGED